MGCFRPIPAWQSKFVVPSTGKKMMVFRPPNSKNFEALGLPCGQCIGCRLERSRQWAIRCVHESKMHDDNCFITLTFRDERLDPKGSLVKSDFQKFMKRLRKHHPEAKIKFFHCGEYGAENTRPHHHACLFGIDFLDKKLLKVENGNRIFISEELVDTWIDPSGVDLPCPKYWIGHYNPKSLGFSTVAAVTFESAAYVARYVLKKWSRDHLQGADLYEVMKDPGMSGKLEEYVSMSRGGRTGKGLAYGFIEEYEGDVFPSDEVVIRGKKMRPPRYYDKCFEVDNPEGYVKMKEKRKAKALLMKDDNTLKRMEVKEACKLSQVKLLKRGYENE